MKSITSAYKTELGKVLRNRLTYLIDIRNASDTIIVSFGTDKIVNVKTVDSSDPLSRVLPTKTITFSVLDIAGEFNPANPNGTWTQLNGDEKIILTINQRYASGQSLTLSAEYYWLAGQATWSDGIATFHATGRVSQFQGRPYDVSRSWGTDADEFTQLTNQIKKFLEDFGLTASDYDVETNTCASHKRSCPENGTTNQAEALQLVANANGCGITETSGKLKVFRATTKTTSDKVRTLTPRDLISYDVEQADELSTAIVYSHEITTDEDADYAIAVQGNVLTTGYVMFTINFDGSASIVDGTAGATINTETYPLDGFTITDSVYGGTDQDTIKFGIHLTSVTLNSFKITPYGITGMFTVNSITNPGSYSVYKTWSLWTRKLKRKNRFAVTSVASGASESAKTLEIDNPLITSQGLAYEVAYRSRRYLENRQLLKVKTRGNPELELFDVVKVVTPKDIYYGLLVQRTANYDGTLEDELVLRVISTPTQIKFINRLQTAWYMGLTNTFWKDEITKQNGGVTPVVGDLIYNVCENANGTSDNTLWEVTAVSNFYLTVSSVSITD